ncbi:hypothetical protein OOJ91_13815 [Micromonospora lupini]|uniref:hypothetical protein n=1 Tax=Micromonospora lupini TaxID=285679 RepID=UPI0022534BA0|nr:hypothetical protein [Micromonospora lupini]MCX5066924.1 hypothetical protein [Micromonospora lupini]
MTQQAALIHQPGRGGIWRRFLLTGPDRVINAAPWMDAVAQHAPVGTCRPCGGYLFPGQPYRPASGNRDWYPAVCATCHTDTAAPGPRPTRKKKRP